MALKENTGKLNIRYLGFEPTVEGGRRLDFSVTAPGRMATAVTFDIPSRAFSGDNRITFQESAAVCYEKLRSVLEREAGLRADEFRDGEIRAGEPDGALHFRLTDRDIVEFRPRGRRMAARNKA